MISANNVSFKYSATSDNGLKNINFDISKGKFIVLCGRSGCGKTTLTRVLNGLIPHFYEGEFSGNIIAGDINVSESELSKTADLIGSVFQNPSSQFFHIDTDGELSFGCENLALKREKIFERVKRSVKDLELERLMGRNIFELSGGEKQQIACGSVYATDPAIYILDEPSSNLDAKAILRLKKTLEILKQAGNTIVISEHRLYYLMELADQFFYMENGKISQIYSRQEMKTMPDDIRQKLGLRVALLKNIKLQNREYKSGKAMIEIRRLQCKRKKKIILDIDHMEFPEDSIIAVVGENGAGKSTFSECLSGLLKCTGEICVNGRNMKPKERIKNSYMVMQDVNLQLFCGSVNEEVMMNVSKNETENGRKFLDKMDLLELRDKHPAALSGGQKQRVAICAAMCAEKEWMFYDEPTSGLDYDGMNRFCNLLEENRTKRTVSFVITHDLELIMGCCTHVMHLERGSVNMFFPLNRENVPRLQTLFFVE